jgi:hypothetical protein
MLAQAGASLPPMVIIPITIALMAVVVAYQCSVVRGVAPASRKRIRLANGWVMLLNLPTVAAGFSLINHATHPRLFLGVWALAGGLLLISVFLALVDVVNTYRIGQASRQALRRELAARLLREARQGREAPAEQK